MKLGLEIVYNYYCKRNNFFVILYNILLRIDEMKSETGTKLQEMADLDIRNAMLSRELSQIQNTHL